MPLDRDNIEGLYVEWLKGATEIAALFYKKHQSYGADNISATGLQGVVVRMWDKINRLRRFSAAGRKGASERRDSGRHSGGHCRLRDYRATCSSRHMARIRGGGR
jgi:hypothetical protein